MRKRKLISLERAEMFLKEFCNEKKLPYDNTVKQLCGTGSLGAVLCVSNPAAPEPDSLANDIETLMLPTLWIKEDENGELYAEETEYTKEFLYGVANKGVENYGK